MKKYPEISVDEYISKCPKETQDSLRKIRAAILEVAPDSRERTDYFQMPGYSYDGDYFYSGMFVWFSYKHPYVRLHLYPPVIQNHKQELVDYPTTKAIVSFPEDKEIPIELVKKLVKASIKAMKDKS